MAGVPACANAIVGSTTILAVQVPVAAPLDQMKARYRRPGVVPFPEGNRYTPEKALLGQKLFHDARLSGSGTLSCATCHNAAFGYSDGLPKAIGHGLKPLLRRSPSIINGAWSELLMWDGSAASLEAQALIPITSPEEMGEAPTDLIRTLGSIEGYKPLFDAAFPNAQMSRDEVAAALATYERTIVTAPTSFDSWIEGDEFAIPESAKRGFALFNGTARCALCHSGWNFSDNGFHDIGLPDGDLGRGRLMPGIVKMQHAFKTPGLRDVALRGPFMHDGSIPSLAAVVAFYNAGGAMRPSQSELVSKLNLSGAQQADIVAFLQSLTSPGPRDLVAALPR